MRSFNPWPTGQVAGEAWPVGFEVAQFSLRSYCGPEFDRDGGREQAFEFFDTSGSS